MELGSSTCFRLNVIIIRSEYGGVVDLAIVLSWVK